MAVKLQKGLKHYIKVVFLQFCVANSKSLFTENLKAAVRNFFWVKNDPKSIFEQVHNQPVFKTIALL